MAPRAKQQQSLPGLENESPARRNTSKATAEPVESAAPPVGKACAPRATPKPFDEGDQPCAPQPQAVDIKGWNVYVVDAYSLIFQVFHALPEMSSPHGEQVGAVFGFVRDMLYLIEDKKPNA